MHKPESATESTQLNLVKSKRLQALRNKSNTFDNEQDLKPAFQKPNKTDRQEDAKSARLRKQVDQRLTQLLAQFPSGKQHSFFKIRFGLALTEFEQLPLQRAAEILSSRP